MISIASAPVADTCKIPECKAPLCAMHTLPSDAMRNLSSPPVSTENVSSVGNLIFVFVSPICPISPSMFRAPEIYTPPPNLLVVP